jgi:hypothetical protein
VWQCPIPPLPITATSHHLNSSISLTTSYLSRSLPLIPESNKLWFHQNLQLYLLLIHMGYIPRPSVGAWNFRYPWLQMIQFYDGTKWHSVEAVLLMLFFSYAVWLSLNARQQQWATAPSQQTITLHCAVNLWMQELNKLCKIVNTVL